MKGLAADESRRRFRQWLYRRRLGARALFRGRDPELPVFLVGTPRSGSTVLATYLASVPDVAFAGEVLNEKLLGGIGGRSPRRALAHIRRTLRASGRRVSGVKLLHYQLQRHGLALDDLRAAFPRARFIVLYRRSVFRQFVSLQIAEATHAWFRMRGWKQETPPRVRVDAARFESYRRALDAFYDGVLSLPWIREASLLVEYEEIERDPQKLFDEKILPFLGLPPGRVSTPLVKQTRGALEETVENFGEFAGRDDLEAVRRYRS